MFFVIPGKTVFLCVYDCELFLIFDSYTSVLLCSYFYIYMLVPSNRHGSHVVDTQASVQVPDSKLKINKMEIFSYMYRLAIFVLQ